MTTPEQPKPKPWHFHPVRWARADFQRLQLAARTLAERHGLTRVTVSDVVRAGAMKEADRIINTQQAA